METSKEKMTQKLREMNPEERKKIYAQTEKLAKDRELVLGEIPLPFVRIPHLIENSWMEKNLQELTKVIEAFNLIELKSLEENREGKELKDRLMESLTIGGRALVSMCTTESEFSLRRRHKRMDTLLSSSNIIVQELNQAAPINIHFHDTCQEAASLVLTALDCAHSTRLLAPKILDWFVDEYKERFDGRFPHTVALPIEHGSPARMTDLPEMAKRLELLAMEKYGEKLEIISCFPYDLKLGQGTIYYQNKIIDFIWRNSAYMNQYRQQGKDISDYEYILRHPEDYLILNSTRSWLTANSEPFALVWDDRAMAQMGFNEGEVMGLRRLIPETHNLKYNQAKWEDIRIYKDEWICRFADMGVGKDILSGSTFTKEAWEKIMEDKARKSGIIFQKKLVLPEIEVMDINAKGELVEYRSSWDFCPHHVNGAFTGSALSRLKNSTLLPLIMV